MALADDPRSPAGQHGSSLWPATSAGWWAVILAVSSIVLVLGWKLMGPAGAFPGLSFGFAGGIVALVSILRLKERAASVVAALVPFAFTVIYLAAELIVGSS